MQFGMVSVAAAEESVAEFVAQTGETKIEFKNYTSGYRTSTGGNVMETGSGGSICIRKKDYVTYDVDVEVAGYYKLTIASTYPGVAPAKPISVSSGDTVLGKCNLPKTEDWKTPLEVVADEIYLEEGLQSLKFETTTDAYFYYFILERKIILIHDVAQTGETKIEFEEYTVGNDEEGTDKSILEVYSDEELSGGEAIHLTNTGDYAIFKFNIPKSGIYKIKLGASCVGSPTGKDVLIKKTDEILAEVDIYNTGAINDVQEYDVCQVFFDKGLVDLTIETNTLDAYFDYIIIEYIREVFVIEAENFSNHKNATVFENAFLSFNTGNWTEYNITVEKDGFYCVDAYSGLDPSYGRSYSDMAVSVDGKQMLAGRVHTTNAWRDFQCFNMGSVYMEAGDHIIKFEVTYGANYFDRFVVDYEGNTLELKNVYANGVKIDEDGEIFRGTDYVELEFSQMIDKKYLTNENVYVTDGEENIAADLVQDGKKVGIVLKETLDFEKKYTVSIIYVEDTSGKLSLNDESFVLYTRGEDDDKGIATVNDVNATIKYEDITVNGKMYSSKSSLISGRKAKVYLADGETLLGYAVTDKDGSFSVSCKLPEGTKEGNISIFVGGEYVDEKVLCNLIYVSENTEKVIIDELKSVEGAEYISQTFEKYENELGIDVSVDTNMLEDSTKVFESISKTDISSFTADEIIDLYYTYIAVEAVNQAKTAGEIENVLKNSLMCEKLEIDVNKIDDLTEDVVEGEKKINSSVIEAILRLEEIKDAEKLISSVSRIIDAEIAKENGKEGKTLSGDEEIAAFSGQGLDISIQFTESFSEMKRIVFEIQGSDESVLNEAEVIKKTYGDIETEVNGNAITVVYTPKSSDFTVSDIAVLRVTLGETTGTRNISISGYVEYDKGLSYLLHEPIEMKNIEITVSENTGKPARDESYVSGGSSSGGSSGGGGNVIVPPEVEKEDDVKDDLPFNDLADVKWAEESIVNLVNLNIISKSEDNKFNPQDNTKREEIVKMIVVALGLYNENAEADFTDVAKNAWFYKYAASAKDANLVTGNDLGEFMAGKYLTREDVATMIWRALKQKGYTADAEYELFADDESISQYAKEAVYQMRNLGIINGMGDNSFAPKSNVTRAQAAKIIYETVRMVTK